MEYEKLKALVDERLSTRAIAKILTCSQSTVKHWLKKHKLKTIIREKVSEEQKKKRSVERVTNRRRKLKLLAVDYKGGKCERCGYDKCVDAFDFHHKNPEEKDFGIGSGHTKSWEKLKKELDKCSLLCANCHREEHAKEYVQVAKVV